MTLSTHFAPSAQETHIAPGRRREPGEVRVPPHDLDAERALLGAMLLTTEAIADAVELLRGSDFYRPAHGNVFDAVIGLYSRGGAVDAVTVSDELERSGISESVGGLAGLLELQSTTPVASNARDYARIVADMSQLRSVIKAAGEVCEIAYSLPEDIPLALDQAEGLFFKAVERKDESTLGSMETLIGDALAELEALYERGGAITGISTGFADLDKKLNGLQPASLTVLGARPSVGKTSLALEIAAAAAKEAARELEESEIDPRNPARSHRPVLFFSLEMSHSEVTQRLICSEARVATDKLRTGRIEERDWSKISHAVGRLHSLPLWIDDSPSISLLEVRAKARRLHAAAGGLSLVVVDYLQLLSGNPRRSENRQVEVSEFSRGLKVLARELSCPVLALSQLSRAPETRQDKRPMLADLRESGAIEQDADVVMFLYRDEVYNPDSKDRGLAELQIAKHRSGPTGRVNLVFISSCTKFVSASLEGAEGRPATESRHRETF